MAGIGYWGVREFSNRVEGMANGDPTAVAQMQEKIADFDVPPGYRTMALSMVIYDTVTLVPEETSGPMIILMQYNSLTPANREEIERGLRQAAEQQGQGSGVSMQVVDSFETVIRGDTVTVTVSEGNGQGLTMRQWITIFEGNNGPVIFMAQGIAQQWDEQVLNDFLRSIR
jgi:hypothetical protein